MLPKNPKAKLRNDVFNPRAIFIGASKSKVKHSPSRASTLLAPPCHHLRFDDAAPSAVSIFKRKSHQRQQEY